MVFTKKNFVVKIITGKKKERPFKHKNFKYLKEKLKYNFFKIF
jgi:hypothetical protein